MRSSSRHRTTVNQLIPQRICVEKPFKESTIIDPEGTSRESQNAMVFCRILVTKMSLHKMISVEFAKMGLIFEKVTHCFFKKNALIVFNERCALHTPYQSVNETQSCCCSSLQSLDTRITGSEIIELVFYFLQGFRNSFKRFEFNVELATLCSHA